MTHNDQCEANRRAGEDEMSNGERIRVWQGDITTLRCDAIVPQRLAALDDVRTRIHDHLAGQRKKICQKSWINGLRREATTG